MEAQLDYLEVELVLAGLEALAEVVNISVGVEQASFLDQVFLPSCLYNDVNMDRFPLHRSQGAFVGLDRVDCVVKDALEDVACEAVGVDDIFVGLDDGAADIVASAFVGVARDEGAYDVEAYCVVEMDA